MKPFDYYSLTSVDQAVALLTKYQDKAALLAGGSDLLGLMKDGISGPDMKPPTHLLDVRRIRGSGAITEQASGLRIGAAVTLTDLATSPVIAGNYSLLADAARQVAVPQIRNVATLGGNLCQRPRCWYFRNKLFSDCLRKGGSACYAQEPESENQNHSVVGNTPCAMVCPSDLALALVALDARAEIAGPKGRRTVTLEKFHMSADVNFKRETVLAPNELLVAVEIPAAARGRKGVYFKVRERQAFDFAQVSVALSVALSGSQVKDARVVFGGVAPFPLRSAQAESLLKGKQIGQQNVSALRAVAAEACTVALKGAKPLSKNGYKLRMASGALEQSLIMLA